MADEHVPTRAVVGDDPVDPLIAFFWARLDEAEQRIATETHYDKDNGGYHACPATWGKPAPDSGRENGEEYGDADCDCGLTARRTRELADVAAKKEILDDYARRCADLDNPARDLECQLIRDVIKRLCTVHAGHPDYDPGWRP